MNISWNRQAARLSHALLLGALSGVMAGAAGAASSVVAWGNNQSGQTAVPSTLTNVVAVAGGGRHSLALQADGTVAAWGATNFGQTRIPAGLSDVIAIAAGSEHNLALRRDGRLVAWGMGTYGQTNVPLNLTNVTAIAAGAYHNLALRSDGTVTAWGRNILGATNVPANLADVTAIAAGFLHSLALKVGGTVVGWGATNRGQAVVPPGLTNVIAIAARGEHSLALRNDGTIVAWGSSSEGLGIVPPNLTNANAIAVACSLSNNLALTSDGVVVVWGTDPHGLSNVPAAAQGYVSAIAAGDAHSLAIVDKSFVIVTPPQDQTVLALSNATFRISVNGNGPFIYQWQKDGTNLVDGERISGSQTASLTVSNALPRDAGSYLVEVRDPYKSGIAAASLGVVPLVAWGSNASGQGRIPLSLTNLVAVAAGSEHNLALRANGTVVAWGANFAGQTNVPTGLSNVVAIAAGGIHSLALLNNGRVVAWGADFAVTNLTGLSGVVAIAAGGSFSLALWSDGAVGAWGPPYSETSIPTMLTLTNVAAIAAGESHSLALRSNGTVIASGRGNLGQTNVPPGLSNVLAIAAGGAHNLALRADGTVVAWGYNFSGQANVPFGLTEVAAIAAGSSHSLVLRSNGTVIAWGRNSSGETNVPSRLTNVVAIAGGGSHNLALLDIMFPLDDNLALGQAVDATNLIWRTSTHARWFAQTQVTHDGVDAAQANTEGAELTTTVTGPGWLKFWWDISNTEDDSLVFSLDGVRRGLITGHPCWWACGDRGWQLHFVPEGIHTLTWTCYSESGDPAWLDQVAFTPKEFPILGCGFRPYGRYTDEPEPDVSFPDLTNAAAIAAGLDHSLVLRNDGTVVVWGENTGGATVLGRLTNVTAIAAGSFCNLALRTDGTVMQWSDVEEARVLPTITNAIAIAAGGFYNLALRNDGTVAAWDHYYNEANVPLGLTNVISVAAGQVHMLALRADGTVVAWGDNSSGQTDVPSGLSNVVAIAAAADFSLALQADGTVVAWGLAQDWVSYSSVPVTAPVGLDNVVAIAAGGSLWWKTYVGWLDTSYALALRSDGTVVGWETIRYLNNNVGYATVPGGSWHGTAIAAGGRHSLALIGDGTPKLTVQPVTRAVLAGNTAQLSVMAAGSGSLIFQWQYYGTNIVGATNQILQLFDAQLHNSGDYSVVVNNALGAATSRVARLTVLQPPRFEQLPPETVVAPGTDVTLSIDATGTPPLRFQWRKNGVNIPDATNATLTITNVQVSDGGSYSVVVANDVGVTVSDPTLLIVEVPEEPPGDDFVNRVTIVGLTNTIGGTNRWATREDGEPLHAGKVGSNSVWYTWQAPTNGIATFRTVGSTFDTLLGVYIGDDVWALQAVAEDEDRGGYLTSQLRFNARAGTYYHIALDGFAGQQGTFIFSWELEPTSEELPVISREPAGTVALLNQDVTFSVLAPGTNLTYQWFFNDVALAGKTDSSLTVSNTGVAEVGIYAVHVSNALGRKAESLPAALQLGSQRHPLTQDKWEDLLSLFGAPGPAPKPSGATLGGPIQVRVGSIDYQMFDTRTNVGSLTDPTPCDVIGGASAWQAFRPVENGVLVIDTQGSTFNTVLVLYSLGDNLTTLREVACNNNAGPGQTWSYIRANVRAGDDYLAVVDGVNGTRGKAALNWRMGLKPIPLALTVSSNMVRRGGKFTLEVNPTDRFPLFYQWRLNGWEIPDATNSVLSLDSLDAWHSGHYSVLIANWFGTVTNDVAQLTVEVPYLRAEYVATNRVYRLTLPQSPELLDSPRLLQSSPDLIHWNTLESIPSFSNPQPYRDFAITNRLFFRVIPRP